MTLRDELFATLDAATRDVGRSFASRSRAAQLGCDLRHAEEHGYSNPLDEWGQLAVAEELRHLGASSGLRTALTLIADGTTIRQAIETAELLTAA